MARPARRRRAAPRPIPPLPHPTWRLDSPAPAPGHPLRAGEFWERLGL